jgi:copper(I)-binding protein
VAQGHRHPVRRPDRRLRHHPGRRPHLGISIEPTSKDKNGKLVSVHGTQVVAFSPKTNGGYLLYGQDATVDDYTKDLPKIIKGETREARSRPVAVLAGALVLTGCGSDDAKAQLSVSSAYMPQPVSDMAAGFLDIANKGGAKDELTSVTSDLGPVSVHETVGQAMEEVKSLDVPAHGQLVFKSGGNHLMFDKLKHTLKQGDT